MNSTPVCYSLRYPSIFQIARCSLSKPLIKMNGLCNTVDVKGKWYFRVHMGVSNTLNKHLFSGIVIQPQRATAQCCPKNISSFKELLLTRHYKNAAECSYASFPL